MREKQADKQRGRGSERKKGKKRWRKRGANNVIYESWLFCFL